MNEMVRRARYGANRDWPRSSGCWFGGFALSRDGRHARRLRCSSRLAVAERAGEHRGRRVWVSIHNGGGVGIGYSHHAGMVVVADGTERSRVAPGTRVDHRSGNGRAAACGCGLSRRTKLRAKCRLTSSHGWRVRTREILCLGRVPLVPSPRMGAPHLAKYERDVGHPSPV